MPNTFKEFKKYLQFLTPWEQITEINHMIQIYSYIIILMMILIRNIV